MKTTLLQAANSSGIGSVFTFLFAIGITLIIFLVLRAVMLWYWKVDTIVSNQQKQLEQFSQVINNQTVIINSLKNMHNGTNESGKFS